VPERVDDPGPTISQLWGAAWALAFAALAAWIFLAIELGRTRPWDSATGFALGAGVTCSVAAACCSVVVAIKSAEQRIRSAQVIPRP
jgi:hypothetical protein